MVSDHYRAIQDIQGTGTHVFGVFHAASLVLFEFKRIHRVVVRRGMLENRFPVQVNVTAGLSHDSTTGLGREIFCLLFGRQQEAVAGGTFVIKAVHRGKGEIGLGSFFQHTLFLGT